MASRSVFSRMCEELSQSLSPKLQAFGFTPPAEPFSRRAIKYEFTRPASSEVQVIEILFDTYRKPAFSVQIYVAPAFGLSTLIEQGGTLMIGSVSASPRGWPFSVQPFRAAPTRLQRFFHQPRDRVKEAVELFLSLVPEVEEWWTHQRSTRHITVSKLNYPGSLRASATAEGKR